MGPPGQRRRHPSVGMAAAAAACAAAPPRWASTAAAGTRRPGVLFEREKERQRALHPRVEKIEVRHLGALQPGATFVLNKHLSTPLTCATHLSEWQRHNSILALVDGQPWDMLRPLTRSCDIRFLTFRDRDPEVVNQAYWRSCAMMLGCAIQRAFKDEYPVTLVRAAETPVSAGAFCYDAALDGRLHRWTPTQENLRSLTKEAHGLIRQDLPFETLDVDAKVALEMFEGNRYKTELIEEKASQNPERTVCLNRFGDFVDVSEGPVIPRTGICFQYEVSAAHSLPGGEGVLHRFQGLSLPVHMRAHHVIWNRLLGRSRKLVPAGGQKTTGQATAGQEARDETEATAPGLSVSGQ
ncbi:39S ribosomal protein L39, mitochondrial [Tachyglossus aculeatus]|uniref:39S ribosomal protein L39, mitochondrial n=1 Tax=Tachyglossus aculeatus TaxID=9261 RepID=UPI0018F5DD55|nr:39S ribosomal protein L39, mitochondrial [Tachyglossus aculeatus]